MMNSNRFKGNEVEEMYRTTAEFRFSWQVQTIVLYCPTAESQGACETACFLV